MLSSALQILYVTDLMEGDEDLSDLTPKPINWFSLLKDSQLVIVSIAICLATSSMAILEPCVPMWLLAHLNPPPSRWQLGAVFIPDSVGYFIGAHFAGII